MYALFISKRHYHIYFHNAKPEHPDDLRHLSLRLFDKYLFWSVYPVSGYSSAVSPSLSAMKYIFLSLPSYARNVT